ncbi:MAG: PKD domain-containing protein [Chloroflexota bacterium]|nr:PKD domain-containing protein [Chloroflexota bacterium]
MTGKKIFQAVIVLMLLLGAPIAAFADGGISVGVTTAVVCDNVDFDIDLPEGFGPYTIRLEFGDTEVFEAINQPAGLLEVHHLYPHGGEYTWTLFVAGSGNVLGEVGGTVTIDGPTVTLGSNPSPPLLTIDGGAASIEFSAAVVDGAEPYFYSWSLDGVDLPDTGLSAPYTFTAAGNYEATVTVTDSGTCGLSHTDTLTVVVVDPESDPQDACHPTAQKIAEAVSIIFLDARAEQAYTCEDIFNIFEGSLTGNHTGFGRLWHAYQLTQTIPDLTWEEMRDWGLDGSSWGALTQLNRFADTLDEYGIRELFDLVVNGDNTVGEIRTAARAAVRYEADFEDALTRISEGANPGELGQFYKLAAEMDVDTATLDQYLADGMSLSELSHAAKMSERVGADWEEVIAAKGSDHSWGDIGQAYKLADDGTSAAFILEMGVQEFRADQRDEEKLAREEERTAREDARTAARKEGLDEKTAARFSKQYDVTLGELDTILVGCDGSWSCVRKELRNSTQTQAASASDKDTRTAAHLAAQYGVGIETVWAKFNAGGSCVGDWNCVRAELRALDKKDK